MKDAHVYVTSIIKETLAEINMEPHLLVIAMPPPLGAGGIMFSGCPSVRPSVRPSEAWNTLFWPVHGSVGPPDQP